MIGSLVGFIIISTTVHPNKGLFPLYIIIIVSLFFLESCIERIFYGNQTEKTDTEIGRDVNSNVDLSINSTINSTVISSVDSSVDSSVVPNQSINSFSSLFQDQINPSAPFELTSPAPPPSPCKMTIKFYSLDEEEMDHQQSNQVSIQNPNGISIQDSNQVSTQNCNKISAENKYKV